MSAHERIERLRAVNPAAVELAGACALAARVEPDLLRRLRLLVPRADAAAEADLWFSDLLSGRDATAITLDPLVAEVLRTRLRDGDEAFREASAAEIAGRHAGAHWSTRLEERIHYLDTARPPGADEEIDDLLLAALNQLRLEADPTGIARWLLGAAGRLPRRVSERTAGRASAAAAAMHLDRQGPPAGLLDAGESQAWLPWLAQSLPQVTVGVQLLDGAVVLGTKEPDATQLAGVPDTDPLVVEVRWNDGTRTGSELTRFRDGEPVQVETGARAATLVTLTGATYDLTSAEAPLPAGLNFDHHKRTLRPCLAREKELGELQSLLGTSGAPPWIGISGRPGSGASTLLVAATDLLDAVVGEHFFGRVAGLDEPAVVSRSLRAQLEARYPAAFSSQRNLPTETLDLTPVLEHLARREVFAVRPLVFALDGLDADFDIASLPLPLTPPRGVHYLVSTSSLRLPEEQKLRTVNLGLSSDRAVCRAMIERDRTDLERAFVGPLDSLPQLADNLPGRLARILAWIVRRPPASASATTIPAPLTREWARVRSRIASRFPRAETLFDIVRAGDGRHTWLDCAEAAAHADYGESMWARFWADCRQVNLVTDTAPDEIIALTEPAIADELLADDRPGDRLLGMRNDSPIDFAHTASPTRLAAAVTHALAIGELGDAHRLCTEPPVARRRYAEDPHGLLADLDAVAAAENDQAWLSSESGDLEPLAPELVALRAVVAGLLKDGVPAAAFAATASDRLVERGARPLPIYRALLAPLRVRRVFDEPELRATTPTRKSAGPYLAIADLGEAEPRLVTARDGPTFEPAIGAARSPDGGFAAWNRNNAWTDRTEPVVVDRVDHAVRLPNGIAVAGPDGTVTVVAERTWELAGSGGRVTAIVAATGSLPDAVVAASEDGTVRQLSDTGTIVYSGHRGAVRCLLELGDGRTVSAGDDGRLHLWSLGRATRPVARWQDAAPITCLARMPGGAVLFGTADGRVETWDPRLGTSTTVGSHDDPVRGVTGDGNTIVSWGDAVWFWNPLPSKAIGFPGGAVDVLLGANTYTVLCGDGSVQQRPRPRPAGDAPERTCLAVTADLSVYTGLDRSLLRISRDGERHVVADTGPFVQAASMGDNVAARAAGGRIDLFAPDGSSGSMAQPADLVAAVDGDRIATSADRSVSIWHDIEVGPPGEHRTFGGRPLSVNITPDTITSIAGGPFAVVAGLANGDTFATDKRLLSGDGRPVTAVAALPDGSVLTGTSAGDVRHWPGPTRFPRRAGAITAMATAEPWVVSGGMDGIVALWATDPVRLAHEIDLGAPVLAVAAKPGLAAARDAHGRLWVFDLETETNFFFQPRVTVSRDETGSVVVLETSYAYPFELTKVEIRADGRPVPVTVEGPWPVVAPDGTFAVPYQLTPSRPLMFSCPAPPLSAIDISVSVVGPEVPGHHTTVTIEQAETEGAAAPS